MGSPKLTHFMAARGAWPIGFEPPKERALPQFHLNVFTSVNALDEEGIKRPSLEVAKLEAIVGARDLVANLIGMESLFTSPTG
jgi:hypothetical protein